MKVFFLNAKQALTKTYERLPDKTVIKSPYPHAYAFTSIEENCTDLKQFAALIEKHAKLGNCLLKGTLTRPLNDESRAGSTNTVDETEWICLDIDGLASITNVDTLLDNLGLSGYSYVVQYSASYGVENRHLRCHVFMLLDRPISAPTLKQWLIDFNLNVAALSAEIRLTRTGNTLRWPLDITTCQNDKLIYIATPVFKNMPDPMPKGRVKLVRKAYAKVPVNSINPNAAVNQATMQRRIAELRIAAGLPKRKFTYKDVKGTEILVKPDQATITGMKTERGFVYFNLNGGDSWAYYHPEGHPDFIYNFKSEPTYLTKELLPDYWEQVHQNNTRSSHQGAQQTSQGILRLAFCDKRSSVYYRGFYDPSTDFLELNPAKNETQIRHFAAQHGMPLGDFIPEWEYTFDPQSPTRVDVTNKVINTFQPTIYMLKGNKKNAPKAVPKTIAKVIAHVLNDAEGGPLFDHFINWLAVGAQKLTRTRTAWIWQGTQGTGKGVLMNHILRPLFGEGHTAIRRMEELNEQYNHFMQSTFFVFVDEVQTKALKNERGVMAKLKNFITEPTIAIRRMYANAVEVPNYTNWIFASNMPDPVAIDKEDRRFNVGNYQPNPITLTDRDMANIANELQAFWDYLLAYPADEMRAGTPLMTADRQQLISISENSADAVASALLAGNFDFFMDHLPTGNRPPADQRQRDKIIDYKLALVSIIDRTQMKDGKCAIPRDDVYSVFEYLVGGMPASPNKFTSYLKHHRIHIARVWKKSENKAEERTVAGIYVNWKDRSKFKEYRKLLSPQAPAQAQAPTQPSAKSSKPGAKSTSATSPSSRTSKASTASSSKRGGRKT